MAVNVIFFFFSLLTGPSEGSTANNSSRITSSRKPFAGGKKVGIAIGQLRKFQPIGILISYHRSKCAQTEKIKIKGGNHESG